MILIVGGVLILAVIAHGIWLAVRNRGQEFPMQPTAAKDDADAAGGDYEDGILSPPRRVASDGAAQEALALQDGVPTEAPAAAEEETAPLAFGAAAAPIAASAETPSAGTTAAIVPDRLPRAGNRAPRSGTTAKPTARRAEPRAKPGNGRGNGKAAAETTEIFAINVLARNGGRFAGTALLQAFERHGLKYRDKNIFHRLDPDTDEVRFSVANAVEPGYFDLADMESLRTPGVSLFFRLPGTAQPAATFDDMLTVARDIGSALGGDLKDEKLSVLTGQTISHFRERIAEFSRKQMSVRPPNG